MAKAQSFFGTNRGFGPQFSRRGLLRAGLAGGTLALGRRTALGQPGGMHAHAIAVDRRVSLRLSVSDQALGYQSFRSEPLQV
jgi:hypothetical protein